ncbi:SDR family oxidoreductase [Paenibacillus terreus]|uniref:SDR family oxidoreductase n=1 Tax=Paenibacillus terreus TaxID=1387834 RepID=A0ABV5B6K4_9BACL
MKEDLQSTPAPVVLITGTSSGFGLLTAVTMARKGYRVAAAMRDTGKKGDLMSMARQMGVSDRIHVLPLDVTDSESIEQAVTEIITSYGRIDVLVNNAGFALGGYVEELPMEDWRHQMETNFFGLVAVTREVLPHMRVRGSGLVINVGSVSGLAGFPGYGPYAASKFAVEGFSESLRHEMAPFGVRIVLVEPGAFRTPIWNKGLERIRTADTSPYHDRLQAVLRYSRKAAETAPDPQQVADLVGRIVFMRSPRLRYAVGRGSGLLIWAKTLLPWKWFERIIAWGLG